MAINADFSDAIRPPVTYLTRKALEHRVRRQLAKRGLALLRTREGTQDRKALGSYAVANSEREIIERNADLEGLARFVGVLASNEALEVNHADL